MSKIIIVGDTQETVYSFSNGVFEIIVESTREQYLFEEYECMFKIYEANDTQAANSIALNEIDSKNFNLFYKYCKLAMDNFPNSVRGQLAALDWIPRILLDWKELIEAMRKDSRYLPQSESIKTNIISLDNRKKKYCRADVQRLLEGPSTMSPNVYEIQAAIDLEKQLGGKLKRPRRMDDKGVDFVFIEGANMGKTINFMFVNRATAIYLNYFFEENVEHHFNIFMNRLHKVDMVFINHYNLTPVNQLFVDEWITTLNSEFSNNVYIIRQKE